MIPARREEATLELFDLDMKTAFIYPRQGSQYVGMGKSLTERFSTARQIFDEADSVLGFSLTQVCLEGPADMLQLTENQQPALLTVWIAAFRVLAERGLEAYSVA